MTSIDDLARRLEQIDSTFDKATQLKQWSFEKTQNNSFGVDGSPDFTVFLSFGEWPELAKVPGNSKYDFPTQFPNPLQAAFKQVLAAGEDPNKKTCFIDLATLNPSREFFTEEGNDPKGKDEDKSVATALLNAVDKIDPAMKPVIRIVCGDHHDGVAPETWDSESSVWRRTFEETFWDENGESRLKHNKNATLWVGYYRPILATTLGGAAYAPTEQWLKDRLDDAAKLVKELNELVTGLPQADKLLNITKTFDPKAYIAKLLGSEHLKRHLSWNHGKILAVNGKTMMTGGGNYWDVYTGPVHDIVDQQAKVTGEAAISAHQWSNYFWNYLNKIPKSDSESFYRCANLGEPPKWTQEEAPSSPAFPTNVPYGDKKVLTVSRIGDWHGKMTDVKYPVGIIDALRDVLLNGVYLRFGSEEPKFQGAMVILMYAIMTEDGEALRHLTEAAKNYKGGVSGYIKSVAAEIANTFSSWFHSPTRPAAVSTTKGSFSPYHSLNVNPNAWASRFARVCAIANAKKSVILCQQRIACPPYGGADAEKLLNDSFHLTKPNLFDGFLWPFDLLIAFGYALARTRNTKTGAAKITIVMATHVLKADGGTRDDWEDKSSIGDLRRKLKAVMHGMAYLNGVAGPLSGLFSNLAAAADVFTHVDPVPENLIDKVVDDNFIVKRALGNGTDYYNHCKIVCVDDRLLYVGSDNAYPSYNEEHGVWIEDAAEVASWKKKFWTEMEKRAVIPENEPEKKPTVPK